MIEIMKRYGCCPESIAWAKDNNIATVDEAWLRCPRADWLLWGILQVRGSLSTREVCAYKYKLLELVSEFLHNCYKPMVAETKRAAEGELVRFSWVDIPPVKATVAQRYAEELVFMNPLIFGASSLRLASMANKVTLCFACAGKPLADMVIPDLIRSLFPDTLTHFRRTYANATY